jgi:hypothetical protein
MTDATPTAAPATGAVNPGKTTGIVGLVLAFLLPLIGFIVSLVARSQSKKAGLKNGPATAGIILGLIFTLGELAVIIAIVVGAAAVTSQCATLGSGVHESNGVTITCG